MTRTGRQHSGGPGPRWAVAIAATAVAIVLAIAAWALVAFRTVAGDRAELVGPELAALLEANRLESQSHLTAQIFREYLLTGARDRLGDLDESAAVVRSLLRSAAARSDTAAVAAAALAEEERLETLRGELAVSGRSAVESPSTAERWLAESLPVRARLDADVAEIRRIRAGAFAATRARLERNASRLLATLLLTTAAALAAGAVLLALLRRSVGDFRASERRFRTTFERAPVGIALVGLDGRWLRLNAKYLEILGYSEEELRSKTTADVTHPADAGTEQRESRRLVAGESDGCALGKRYVRKDGSEAWVELTASLVRDDEARPQYLILVAEDVGERREIERRLREAVQTRDDFMEIASHELRTPLTTLRLQVESLRAALGRGTPPERVVSKADAALRQAGRLGTLVEGLLEVARLDEASFAIRPERGDLARTVREAVEQMRPAAERESVDLRVDAPGQLEATFDAARIRQALAAVLSNAVKYGPGKPVDVRLRADGAVAIISVRDRGIGVGAAERERIFERFERAVSARHYGGLGLGLFVTRRIVEAHGGTARVDAAEGSGTVLVLELPLANSPRARAAGEPA